MTEIVVAPSNSAYSSLDGVFFNKDRSVVIMCPGGKGGSYTIDLGGNVIYTVQNERMKKVFFDRGCTDLPQEIKDAMTIKYCDVTVEDEVRDVFNDIGDIDGLVHSVAFANPKTCLGNQMYTSSYEDIKLGFHISCVSLATVSQFAQEHMPNGGSIVTIDPSESETSMDSVVKSGAEPLSGVIVSEAMNGGVLL